MTSKSDIRKTIKSMINFDSSKLMTHLLQTFSNRDTSPKGVETDNGTSKGCATNWSLSMKPVPQKRCTARRRNTLRRQRLLRLPPPNQPPTSAAFAVSDFSVFPHRISHRLPPSAETATSPSSPTESATDFPRQQRPRLLRLPPPNQPPTSPVSRDRDFSVFPHRISHRLPPSAETATSPTSPTESAGPGACSSRFDLQGINAILLRKAQLRGRRQLEEHIHDISTGSCCRLRCMLSGNVGNVIEMYVVWC
ncbi:uncharacterized protein LOC109831298 [Asparagus officinalis]|uniref:uncharacterized protein LOC109831298 n=1 Tax=Asparagus officinalis TaxID=4686 RepID=UPI00098E295A|nr:uncharacterized protein LOC109831298 [Asparagus officinalis]